jgi:hypothetical protein
MYPSAVGNKSVALSIIADRLARAWKDEPSYRQLPWDRLRDCVDQASGGDLDCQPLDILTDMVEKRLNDVAAKASS